MRINLISSLNEESTIESVSGPNQVYAWFLRKAFVEMGVDAQLIHESTLVSAMPRETDHTIVISVAFYGYTEIHEKLKKSTAGKLARYMNADKLRGDGGFDYCFTQIGPVTYQPEKYVCVGWGVDPSYSYPEQAEKAAFLDSKNPNRRKLRKAQRAYQIYDAALSAIGMKVYNPVPVYNESDRLPYPDYHSLLRKCHYFLCTQFGDGGLSRLEAASCGALLVVPSALYRERTMSLLNHQVWNTEEELLSILHEDVDVEANRQRALEHTWDNVVKRILNVLNS